MINFWEESIKDKVADVRHFETQKACGRDILYMYRRLDRIQISRTDSLGISCKKMATQKCCVHKQYIMSRWFDCVQA